MSSPAVGCTGEMHQKVPWINEIHSCVGVWKNHKIKHGTSAEMVAALRDAVRAIREDKLGFKSEQVGTHSQRSGAAMALYLWEFPVYTIMMIGRWSSDAF